MERLREPVAQRPQRATVVAPRRPGVTEVGAERWHVAREDREVDVLVLARHAGEGLDRPAAHDPPGPVETGHERRDAGRVERLPDAVPAVELGVLVVRDVHRAATVATSARWSEPAMSTVWVPSEARESLSSTWSILTKGGSSGKMLTWLAGHVGCHPLLASSPASRYPASSSSRMTSWSGVAFMSPTIRSASFWMASARIRACSRSHARGSTGAVGCTASRVSDPISTR